MPKPRSATLANRSSSGLSGEYFVMSELLRRDASVLHTALNHAGFDLIAFHPSGKPSMTIEVKTVANRQWVHTAPRDLKEHVADFFVLVRPAKNEAVGTPALSPFEAIILDHADAESIYKMNPKGNRPYFVPNRLRETITNTSTIGTSS